MKLFLATLLVLLGNSSFATTQKIECKGIVYDETSSATSFNHLLKIQISEADTIDFGQSISKVQLLSLPHALVHEAVKKNDMFVVSAKNNDYPFSIFIPMKNLNYSGNFKIEVDYPTRVGIYQGKYNCYSVLE